MSAQDSGPGTPPVGCDATPAADAGLRVAHLSDPHLPLPPGPHPGTLRGKRLLSRLSWHLSRYRRHRPEILQRVVADLQDHAPDRIAVTGDLTNLGLAEEYRRARLWLQTLGPPDRVMVIPGNHEALVPQAWETGAEAWRPYWQGAATAPDTAPGDAFPTLRQHRGTALIGMSSAVATPLGRATGAAGAAQIDRLGPLLRAARAQGLFRLLMIHHPPLDGTVRRRKRLLDSAALRAVLAQDGVELVLHGHSHRSHFNTLPTCDGDAPVIGAPSASSMHHEPAAWHLYRITPHPGGWDLQVTARCLGPDQRMTTRNQVSQTIERAHAG